MWTHNYDIFTPLFWRFSRNSHSLISRHHLGARQPIELVLLRCLRCLFHNDDCGDIIMIYSRHFLAILTELP